MDRHARTALVLEDFYRRLTGETKQTPYPAAELERLYAPAPEHISGA